MKINSVRPEFVETIPTALEDGVLYISILYKTCQHRCCCGCGERVVTPLDPKFWKLSYNGQTVSLGPSIGNRDFDCGSHYFITNGRVRWARSFETAEEPEFISRSVSAQSAQTQAPRKKRKGKLGKVKDWFLSEV